MQIVVPKDIEDALREDVGAALGAGWRCCASPAPDDLDAGTVCFTALGGAAATPVSHTYDVSVDVWGATYADAMARALEVQAFVASLDLREHASGRHYPKSGAQAPYPNPDPRRPLLPRATFRAAVDLRGKPIT